MFKKAAVKGIKIRDLLIFFIVAVAVMVLLKKGLISGSDAVFSEKDLIVQGEVTPVYKDSIVCFGGEMVFEAYGSGINARNIDKDIVWGLKIPGKIKSVFNFGDKILVFDESNKLACITKMGNLLWNKEIKGQIKDILVDEKGYVLLVVSGTAGNSIEIYDAKGTRAGNLRLPNSAVLDFTAYGNDIFCVSIIDMSRGKIDSKIIGYKFSGEMIWSVMLDSEIIHKLQFGRKNNLYALGEKNIYIYKNDGKLLKKAELEGKLVRFGIGEDLIAALIKDRSKYKYISFDQNLNKLGEAPLESNPEGLYTDKDGSIAFFKEHLISINKNCSHITLLKSPVDINRAFKINKNIYIVSNRKLLRLQYQ